MRYSRHRASAAAVCLAAGHNFLTLAAGTVALRSRVCGWPILCAITTGVPSSRKKHVASKYHPFSDDLKGGPYGRLDWMGYPLALKHAIGNQFAGSQSRLGDRGLPPWWAPIFRA